MGTLYKTDPLLRLVPRDFPMAFMNLSDDEQRWRGRLFLMTYSLTGHAPHAWFVALSNEPEPMAAMKALVESTPDAVITGEMRRLAREQKEAARG